MRIYSVLCLFFAGCVAAPSAPSGSPPALDFSSPVREGKQDRPITSADLMSLRDIGMTYIDGGMSISPDGRKVAFQVQRANVETNSYALGWFVAGTEPGGAAHYVGDGGEMIFYGQLTSGRPSGAFEPGEAKWSPDGQWIAYRKKIDGEIQIWRARTDGAGEEQLTKNPGSVIKFDWSEDGSNISFDVTTPSPGEYAESLRREGEAGYLYDKRFLPAESRLPLLRQDLAQSFRDEEAPAEHFVYDLALRTEAVDKNANDRSTPPAQDALKEIFSGGDKRDVRNVIQHGSNFAWLENTDPETFKGPFPPLTVGRRNADDDHDGELCAAPECSGFVTDVWLDETSGEVFFRRREGASFSDWGLFAWSKDGKVRSFLKSDDRFSNCEYAHGSLICLLEGWKTPRRIARINVADGSVDTIIDPNPEFRNLKLSHVEKLEWRADNGADATGHLVYPLDYVKGKRYPLVIVQYRSRGFLRGGVGDEYPIHVFAATGFAVLSYDSPSRWDALAKEGDFFMREAAYWGEGFWERETELSAIENVIDILDERGIVDPARVGITGLSNGAENVWYAMMHSDKFAVASASSGGWTPSTYYLLPASARQSFYNEAAGLQAPGTGGDARWRHISPEFHADTINTPILIQGADTEFLRAVPAHEALKDAGKPIEMYVFPDEYHVKWQPKHRAAVYERNVDWMNFWLRDVEDADPEKTAQYERWRKLREQHEANLAKLETAQ